MLQRKRRSSSLEVFFSGNLSRCLSDVPCAAVVVLRHEKPAGRLVFATAIVLNDMLLVVNKGSSSLNLKLLIT